MLSLKWSPSNNLSDFQGQSFPVKVICNDVSVHFGGENNYKQIPKVSGPLRCLQLMWLSMFPGLIPGPSMQGVLIVGICQWVVFLKAVFPASVWRSQGNMFKIRFLETAFPAQLVGGGKKNTMRSFPTLERQVICSYFCSLCSEL